MNPRTLYLGLPLVFVASLGLGYILAPQAKVSALPSASISRAQPAGESETVPDRTATSNNHGVSPAPDAPSKTGGSADDVFNALSSLLWCERAYEVQRAIDRLDVPQLQAVLERIDTIIAGYQYYVLPRAIDRLMDLDPQKALSWIESNASTFREGSNTFVVAFEMAYKKDPAGARRIYDALPEGDRRNAFGEAMVRNMAMKDPASANAFLETLPKGTARDRLTLGYVAGLATSNPTAAIGQALQWKEGVNRRETLAKAFVTLASSGQGLALAEFDRITTDHERVLLLGRLTSNARQNDIQALAAFYQTIIKDHPVVADGFVGIERLAEGYARENPAGALAWTKELPDDQQREAQTTALSVWGSTQPEAALEWARQNSGDDDHREKNLETVYRSWLKTDLPKAQAWAEQLAPGPDRDRHIGLVASQLAVEGQHDRALDILQRLPAEQQSALATEVANSLAWQNPASASRWLSSIEPDENSASLFHRVASEWAGKDFKATASWIETIPAGECRDHAVWAYASKVVRLDPAAAADWAASASTEESREGMLSRIVREWKARDPEGAERWLDGTKAISAGRKTALKEFIQ